MTRASAPRLARRAALFGAAALALALAACTGGGERSAAPPPGVTFHALPSGEALSFAEVAARARAAELVIVGEIHDQPVHQQVQAALISAIQARAAAFEMVPRAREAALAELRAAGGPEAAGAKTREAAAWDRYAAWAPPIEALAPDAPALGAGLPRSALRLAIKEGAAAAFEGDAAAYALDTPLPADMAEAMRVEQIDAHCGALPEAMAPGMVEAQRLRDAAFADALLRAVEAGDPEAGPPVLVTGNGHARRGRGSPRYIAAAAPDADLLVIGQAAAAPGQSWQEALAPWAAQNPDGPVFDILAVSTRAPGDGADPCAALRARMQNKAQAAQ
ncbi:ChaN family lipoprotein [Rhodovulum sp. DZ06]|uniref:ChaN family lipoprotein n=1 Tax=Rhodovulum sp. DZ06 TaxID=3425126 RepID=UPI003D33219E